MMMTNNNPWVLICSLLTLRSGSGPYDNYLLDSNRALRLYAALALIRSEIEAVVSLKEKNKREVSRGAAECYQGTPASANIM